MTWNECLGECFSTVARDGFVDVNPADCTYQRQRSERFYLSRENGPAVHAINGNAFHQEENDADVHF